MKQITTVSLNNQAQVFIFPILRDNYAYVFKDASRIFLIDPGDGDETLAHLSHVNLQPTHILITHRDWDHVDGIAAITAAFNCPVAYPETLLAEPNQVPGLLPMDTSGHSDLDVTLYFPDAGIAFVGDTLFVGGCGRVPQARLSQMYQSLQKLLTLPKNTLIFGGHEYALANLSYAAHCEPHNQAIPQKRAECMLKREQGKPTYPTTLAEECSYNPFLRAADEKTFIQRRLEKNTF